MQFYDEVRITINSGKWGDWVATGRREAWVPYWWPSGWNWWKGGSIIFRSDQNTTTLLFYKFKKIFKAKAGEPWRSRDQYWANAANIVLTVPVGTLIKDKDWKVLHIFAEDQASFSAYNTPK